MNMRWNFHVIYFLLLVHQICCENVFLLSYTRSSTHFFRIVQFHLSPASFTAAIFIYRIFKSYFTSYVRIFFRWICSICESHSIYVMTIWTMSIVDVSWADVLRFFLDINIWRWFSEKEIEIFGSISTSSYSNIWRRKNVRKDHERFAQEQKVERNVSKNWARDSCWIFCKWENRKLRENCFSLYSVTNVTYPNLNQQHEGGVNEWDIEKKWEN